MKEPFFITGGTFTDSRGSISYVNEFRVEEFCRFYIIEHSDTDVIRAWQGHRSEIKAFYVVRGAFMVNVVSTEDLSDPDPFARVMAYRLSESESRILIVPEGNANGFCALTPGSKMVVFSNLKLDESNKDIVRIPAAFWKFRIEQNR